MINLEELSKTSLIQLMKEIDYTNKLLDNIDMMLADGTLQTHIRKRLISKLNDLELYYRTLEKEIIRRGWANENDLSRKIR